MDRTSRSGDGRAVLSRSIAITSGKGGVGKTNLAANLAYSFCRQGRRVLLVDADLGLANVEVLLGLATRFDIWDVLHGRCAPEEAIVAGPGGMHILPARSGAPELTALSDAQRGQLVATLESLSAGYDRILFDTAAGISPQVLFFAELAARTVVVVCPEPTALADAYALMKICSRERPPRHFELVVNQCRTPDERVRTGDCLEGMVRRFLDATLDVVGSVPFDSSIPRAVRSQRLVIEAFPASPGARSMSDLARFLLMHEAATNPPRTVL